MGCGVGMRECEKRGRENKGYKGKRVCDQEKGGAKKKVAYQFICHNLFTIRPSPCHPFGIHELQTRSSTLIFHILFIFLYLFVYFISVTTLCSSFFFLSRTHPFLLFIPFFSLSLTSNSLFLHCSRLPTEIHLTFLTHASTFVRIDSLLVHSQHMISFIYFLSRSPCLALTPTVAYLPQLYVSLVY